MRVAIIVYGSINTITGGYIYDQNLLSYLQARDVVVKIFSQPHNGFLVRFKNNFSSQLINDINQFEPDIILQDGMNLKSLFLLNRQLKKHGKYKIIAIVHLLESHLIKNRFQKTVIRTIEKYYFNTIDAFIFNSRSTETAVQDLVGRTENSVIAYPGKDRLKFENLNQNFTAKCSQPKIKIIFIGNLMHNKGLHLVLQALGSIKNDLWYLSVMGGLHFEPQYTKKILHLISYLSLQQNVKIFGTLEPEKLQRHLTDHHLLVVPSYFESFGIVYAEAMGAGIPVIATSAGGAHEIVSHNSNGFLVNPGNIIQLRKYIYTLISDRRLLIRMSQAALATYKTLPSWQDSCQKVYEFLLRNQVT